eukprot:scaffold3911_cov390-Prasinococcus_capsulatus_cf.AAC.3
MVQHPGRLIIVGPPAPRVRAWGRDPTPPAEVQATGANGRLGHPPARPLPTHQRPIYAHLGGSWVEVDPA